MARDVNPPRGMRDFLPAEKARREHALGVIRQTYAAHGFDEIETPVVEDYDRLHSGLGGDNEKLGFSVLKRGLSHDDLAAASAAGDPHALADLGLRFDLTVPLARYYATHRAERRAHELAVVPHGRVSSLLKFKRRVDAHLLARRLAERLGPLHLARIALLQKGTVALCAAKLKNLWD